MKTVVLDGYTLNPGDLSWEDLERLSSCEIFDRSSEDQVVERCQNADIIATNKVAITAEIMDQLPTLEFIIVMATGYNNIDLKAAKEHNITVCNSPEYSTYSVLQHTFSLILALCNPLESQSMDAQVNWASKSDFSYSLAAIPALESMTLGLIGYGAIGSKVAQVASAFGMKVLVQRKQTDIPAPKGIRYVDQEELLSKSDVISLHCPLTEETKEMANLSFFKAMKSTAFFINTARGGLVQEEELAIALNQGIVAGAGLDVLSQEPPAPDQPLLSAKNCLITPHQAWASVAARKKLMNIIVENTRAFLSGDPQNVVS